MSTGHRKPRGADQRGTTIGIDTAAQTSGRSGQTVAGYALPIDTALAVADQITSGVDDATSHQGVPAFLGIQTTSTGASVDGVVSGFAAQKAGITAGSTITAASGTAISSSAELTTTLAAHDPGDRVSVTWIDTSGTSHTTTVTLGSGPAD